MTHWQAYPQRPEYVATPIGQPDYVPLIHSAETIVIEARHGRDQATRETCKEFIGYYVPTQKAQPAGDTAYCCTCHDYFNVRDFYPDASKKNGLMSRCKACERKRKKRAALGNFPRM